MLVVPDYRGIRIQIDAVPAGARWKADVRIRRVLSNDRPRVERMTCSKLAADHAERSGEIWARRWVDLNRTADDGPNA